ncbi:unnamed protein product [Moneuplotes crassus]|uniref:Uncharacterized protein n=1 Tax=Euplotes crassus TaxID=5936 RepID=A0AAD1Y2L2_EUPCR|nr:unnamed protein product [Moneuplotes crassus]
MSNTVSLFLLEHLHCERVRIILSIYSFDIAFPDSVFSSGARKESSTSVTQLSKHFGTDNISILACIVPCCFCIYFFCNSLFIIPSKDMYLD